MTRLTGPEQESVYAIFRFAVGLYFKERFELYKRYPMLSSHSVQDARLRIQLEANTLEKYECVARQMMFFAFVLTEEKPTLVTDHVRNAIQSICKKSGDNKLCITHVHRFMTAALLDVIETQSGDVGFIASFVACMSVIGGPAREMLRYGEAREVSPTLAALKYCVRFVAVLEVGGYGITKSSATSWEYIHERTGDTATDTGAKYVAFLSYLAHSVMASESMRVRFTICAEHSLCGVIDGVEIFLSELGKAISGLQEKVADLLYNKVMGGLKLDEKFWESLTGLNDALQNKSKDFWFGSSPANASFIRKCEMLLWNHRGEKSLMNPGNIVNVEACKHFLSQCEDIQKYILVLSQLTSGSPSRASEIAVTRVVNDALGTRNVFISGKMLVFASSYTKTRSLNDGREKPIARFPDAVTSGLVLVYLTVVRPVEFCIVKCLAELAGEDRDVTDQKVFMFSRRGSHVSGATLCAWFKEAMSSLGFESIGVSQYRQYQAEWLRTYCGCRVQTTGSLRTLKRGTANTQLIASMASLKPTFVNSLLPNWRHSAWRRGAGIKLLG